MVRTLIIGFCVAFAIVVCIQFYPNSQFTGSTALVPGATNPQVSQANIRSTICVKGWTATIRPPSSYTTALKIKQMQQFHLKGNPADLEEDHLISLELGGNPTDPNNLWPQAYLPVPGAHEKDKLENYLKAQVCGGNMTLAEAQKEISTNWLIPYSTMNSKLGGIHDVLEDGDDL